MEEQTKILEMKFEEYKTILNGEITAEKAQEGEITAEKAQKLVNDIINDVIEVFIMDITELTERAYELFSQLLNRMSELSESTGGDESIKFHQLFLRVLPS